MLIVSALNTVCVCMMLYTGIVHFACEVLTVVYVIIANMLLVCAHTIAAGGVGLNLVGANRLVLYDQVSHSVVKPIALLRSISAFNYALPATACAECEL
jgi:hypothetical protein